MLICLAENQRRGRVFREKREWIKELPRRDPREGDQMLLLDYHQGISVEILINLVFIK